MWYVVWNGSVFNSENFEDAINIAKGFVMDEEEYDVALIAKYDNKTRNIKMWVMRWLAFGAFEMIVLDI